MILVIFRYKSNGMKFIFTSIISSILFISSTFAQGSWEMVKQKDGITIHNRKMDGSKLKEFKGSVVVNSTVEEVLGILQDYKMHDKFVYKCKKGSVELIKKSGNDLYTYMIIETPWPASNRDLVTLYHTNPPAKDGSITINVSAVNGMRPTYKGIVRVEDMKGYWKITPLGNGKVEVMHQAYSRPGGNVPDGMANSAAVDAPFEMLTRFKALFK